MLEAVTATYDGKNFIFDEDLNLMPGQKVIITILKPQKSLKDEVDEYFAKNKLPAKIDVGKYSGSGGKMFESVEETEEYIRSLRDDREF